MRQTILLLLILSCGNSYLFGQSDCQAMLSKAMNTLPMDSLDKAVAEWESHCSGKQEVRITRLLLNIEEDKFSIKKDVDSSLLLLLNCYAINFPSPQNQELPEKLFYKFSIAWAKVLLKNKKLDDNEKFICNVLGGDIYDPQREIEKNTARYPEFTAMLGELYEDYRRGTRTNIAISTGLWRPTKNLSILGIHPSAGLHIGARNFHHELDLTLQFRFSKSANEYIVYKGGYSITSDSYLGGYIGNQILNSVCWAE